MRGSPLLRALLAFLIIASMGWPLWVLTRPDAEAAPATSAPPPEIKKAIQLHLTFTTVPKAFSIRHLDQDVWKEAAPQADMEHELTVAYPPEGVDLQFHIEWPEDAPLAAVRVQLTDPAGDTHEKSLWGKGVDDDVLTFP
jgi:hypothetical protein